MRRASNERNWEELKTEAKVLVFCLSNFSQMRGGFLWTRNMLDILARTTNMNCIVISAWLPEVREDNERFVRGLGMDHIFLPITQSLDSNEGNEVEKSAGVCALHLLSAFKEKYYFLGERLAKRNMHIDKEMRDIIIGVKPRLLLVNDIWSSMYIPSAFSLSVPRCLTITDSDVAFHRAHRAHGGEEGKDVLSEIRRRIVRHGNWIANWRFRNYVRRIHNRCDGVVALSRTDLPSGLRSGVISAVLPPLLTESSSRWSYQASRCLLFVGNVAHFANRLAVEWICDRLAPEIHRLDKTIRINVIGASADQVRTKCRLDNVNLLGEASAGEVRLRMISDDLFVAPIANSFGAKLKLAECSSHGMPFLATAPAMSGLSFLKAVPTIDLEMPRAAALLITQYVNNPEALACLSSYITDEMRQARMEQDVAWRAFLGHWLGA